ncbi:MAG: hypothetical protein P1U89_17545 [Verrucomicrobiales bacterium]|nr:hypothetical protein [Verrucomicrobiales bacterium]
MNRCFSSLYFPVICALSIFLLSQARADIEKEIQALFEAKCRSCHHPDTDDEFPYLHAETSLQDLVEDEVVVVGQVDDSSLFGRVTRKPGARGRMPKSKGEEGDEEYKAPLDAKEVALLKAWINQEETVEPVTSGVTDSSEKAQPRPATFEAAQIPQDSIPAHFDLESKARHILKQSCTSCHHPDDVSSPDMNLSLAKLTEKNKQRSIADQIMERISLAPHEKGFMPEDGDALSREEISILTSWFQSKKDERIQRELITQNEMIKMIYQDIRSNENAAPFYRYLTLTNLYNITEFDHSDGKEYAFYDDSQMETYRAGLSLLINSLSMGGKVVQPTAIDENRTLFRIDLRDYGWKNQDWERVVNYYPHGILGVNSRDEKYIRDQTHSRMAYLRGDWFVFATAQPPLYDDILDHLLGIYQTDDKHIQQRLEAALHVDRVSNLQRGDAVRAGFFDSGVSDHNRLIERHEAAYGSYWVSYDFKHRGASDAQDLRKAPLGPHEAHLTQNPHLVFEHDGGEMIYNLPNGLQGYLLATASGERLDKAPKDIVRSNRGDGTIINGISCMGCHDQGMKPADRYSTRLADMEDLVRPFVEKSGLLGGRELALLQKLYPEKPELQRVINLDAERFQDAKRIAMGGFQVGSGEPINELYEAYYLHRINSRRLAAEFGIDHEEMMLYLEEGLLESDSFRTTYFSLKNGDAEPREQMLQQFLRVAYLLNFHLLPFEPLGYEEFEGQAFASLIANDPLFVEAFGKTYQKEANYSELQKAFKQVKKAVEQSKASYVEQSTSSVLLPGGGKLSASVETEVAIGGEGTLSLTCDRDLHLRILLFSADGKITQFYPNDINPDSFVPFSKSGGKAFNIPFHAIANQGGKIGAEYFRIFGSTLPLKFTAQGVPANGFREFKRDEIFTTRGAIALKAGFGTKIPKVAADSKFHEKQGHRIFETKVGYVLRSH